MGKKAKGPKEPTPLGTVTIVADGDAFGMVIDSDLPPETMAAILRATADDLEGKNDRAVGAWGR